MEHLTVEAKVIMTLVVLGGVTIFCAVYTYLKYYEERRK